MDKEALISENLRLVHSCCNKFKGRGIEYDDLYGAGCLGLVKAANAFKEELGFCFSTYAVPVILGEIKRLFRDGGAIKVSRSLKELSLKSVRKKEQMQQLLGREPTVFELSKELSKTPEEIAEALCASMHPSSLSYYNEEGEIKEVELGLSSSAEELLFDRLAIGQAMEKLNEEEQRLIILRYFGNKTQSETAKILSMSQVQVSRKEKKILNIMKEALVPPKVP